MNKLILVFLAVLCAFVLDREKNKNLRLLLQFVIGIGSGLIIILWEFGFIETNYWLTTYPLFVLSLFFILKKLKKLFLVKSGEESSL